MPYRAPIGAVFGEAGEETQGPVGDNTAGLDKEACHRPCSEVSTEGVHFAQMLRRASVASTLMIEKDKIGFSKCFFAFFG